MSNLTKKEIGTVNVAVLNARYCRLILKGETLPANEISVANAREILWIEDELRRKIIKLVGHDFYPLDHIEEKEISDNCAKKILSPIKPKIKPGLKIKFHITVISSIGIKAANFNVEADSKNQADILARKQIRKLGLHGATHKIS
ncbi:MAG: hypothetical protein KAT69_03170 [Candidatus Aminicenantes bacterium]|nr:hypothetical protein [Candidatus Aminicenantes bacterium]